MYVRFVVSVRSGRGHVRRGLFRVADRLESCGLLEERDRDRAAALLAWFNRRLTVPWEDVFLGEAGLCWYKPGALACIDRSRDLAALFRKAGWRALEIWNRDPGVVTYEDEAQIVARPRHVAGSSA